MTGLEIPLPTASPFDDPGQYTPLLLSAIGVFLLSPDIWLPEDYTDARGYMNDLMVYIVELMEEDAVACPVGATVQWHTATPPARWLLCNGQSVLKADYPKLWDLWGAKYGSTSTHFNVIDLRDVSPIGVNTHVAALDGVAGAATVTLTTAQMPAHTHAYERRLTNGAGAFFAAMAGQASLSTDGIGKATGGGDPHNNLSPVKGVHFMVYAGRNAP